METLLPRTPLVLTLHVSCKETSSQSHGKPCKVTKSFVHIPNPWKSFLASRAPIIMIQAFKFDGPLLTLFLQLSIVPTYSCFPSLALCTVINCSKSIHFCLLGLIFVALLSLFLCFYYCIDFVLPDTPCFAL